MSNGKQWSEDRDATLLKLTADGKSAMEIAAILGEGLTRNAIIGRWQRLRERGMEVATRGRASAALAARPPKAAPYLSIKPEILAKPKGSARVLDVALGDVHFTKRGRSYNRSGTGNPIVMEIKEPVPFTNGERIGLLQLTSHTCRWPIGDPLSKDFCFCGHTPRDRSPYCKYHAQIAYQPLQERRQA